MPDMGKGRQLYAAREGDMGCEANRRAVLAAWIRLYVRGEIVYPSLGGHSTWGLIVHLPC